MARKKKVVNPDIVTKKPEEMAFEPLTVGTQQKRQGKTWGKPEPVQRLTGKVVSKRDTKSGRWVNPDFPKFTLNPTPAGESKARRSGNKWIVDEPAEVDEVDEDEV